MNENESQKSKCEIKIMLTAINKKWTLRIYDYFPSLFNWRVILSEARHKTDNDKTDTAKR
jgi:hypothetical protein